MRHVTILGAGLTGPLLALYLARRGYHVDIYEQRPDFRVHGFVGGRSINLALSDRGIRGLHEARVEEEVMKDAIPMKGRMVHGLDGSLQLQPYSRTGRHINSISRGGLNITLANASEHHEDVKFHFDLACVDVDLERKQIKLRHTETGEEIVRDVDLLFAADGANSSLRQAMERKVDGFTARTEWLSHGYKELEIPPGPNGEFLIEKNALHIWPHHDFMMIALPNPDATFTCTLFAPMEGENGFDQIKTDDDVRAYFQRFFPDALPLMPTLIEDWHNNPTSQLGTLYCGPWHVDDWACLIGDAAHAIVPFYGQGMNAGFEDCRVLNDVLNDHEDEDWGEILQEFYLRRKRNTDAIAQLAVSNFLEMRSKVVDEKFLRKKKIDAALADMFPDRWAPLYEMVTFSHIPYADALEQSKRQDELLEHVGYDQVEATIGEGTEKVEEVLFGVSG
ncbi:MAG: FAD-dependent oxidoreductase [Candidatus Kapaibacterium sp.]